MAKTEFQIQIDGDPVRWYSMMSQEVINDFISIAADDDGGRVAVVRVDQTEILSSYEYGQFERHFKEGQSGE